MSDSVWSHRWQPTRLPCPWDSPSKNTGVGCHFLLQCMRVKSESEVTQLCPTLHDPLDCSPPGSSVHGIFQTRVLEWGAIALSISLSSLRIILKIEWQLLRDLKTGVENGQEQREIRQSQPQTPSHWSPVAKALPPHQCLQTASLRPSSLSSPGQPAPTGMNSCLSLTFSYKCVVCSVAQSCMTLCDPMGCTPPGSSVHGISQARILPVACRFLLQAIFLNSCLLHHRRILDHCATWEAFQLQGRLEMHASDVLSFMVGD